MWCWWLPLLHPACYNATQESVFTMKIERWIIRPSLWWTVRFYWLDSQGFEVVYILVKAWWYKRFQFGMIWFERGAQSVHRACRESSDGFENWQNTYCQGSFCIHYPFPCIQRSWVAEFLLWLDKIEYIIEDLLVQVVQDTMYFGTRLGFYLSFPLTYQYDILVVIRTLPLPCFTFGQLAMFWNSWHQRMHVSRTKHESFMQLCRYIYINTSSSLVVL